MVWYVVGINFGYVARRLFSKICQVCFLGEFIPFGTKHTLAPRSLKRQPHSADASKQVDKFDFHDDIIHRICMVVNGSIGHEKSDVQKHEAASQQSGL